MNEQWQTLMAANPEAAARATKQLEALREERDGLRVEVQRLTEKNKKLIKFSTDGVVALDEVTAERNSLREVLKPDRPTPKQYTQHPPELDWLPAAGRSADLGLLVTERDALAAIAWRDALIADLRAENDRDSKRIETLAGIAYATTMFREPGGAARVITIAIPDPSGRVARPTVGGARPTADELRSAIDAMDRPGVGR